MSENGYATLEQLQQIAKQPRPEKDVVLPVSGLKVRLRGLSERDKAGFEAEALTRDGSKLIRSKMLTTRPRLIIRCTVNPPLTEANLGILQEFDSRDLQHWFNECAELTGLSTKEIEDFEGNSETSLGEVSATA